MFAQEFLRQPGDEDEDENDEDDDDDANDDDMMYIKTSSL